MCACLHVYACVCWWVKCACCSRRYRSRSVLLHVKAVNISPRLGLIVFTPLEGPNREL
uniref:Uncharacterized protein n=1 Tax=Anguilla anguilla TaxID=7936 RepID=A0A0E9USC2_ANGAN